VAALCAPLPDFLLPGQRAVYRALRAVVGPFVEQDRIDLRGSQIGKPRLVQHVEHPLALGWL